MSSYDYDGGPPNKRQRPERETIENPPEFFNTSQNPSKVLNVADLHPRAQEPDLLEAFGRFGRIAYVCIKRQPRNNMGLVEFDSMDGSASAMVGLQSQPALVCHQPVIVNYSAVPKIPRFGFESDCPNKVLVVFVTNVQFNINAYTLHDICKSHGTVLRVAVVKRHPILTALIEFESIEQAKTCKYAINGADIYTNSCTIKVEFAKISNVRITIPDDDHADFCGGLPAEQAQNPMRRTLMGAPPTDRAVYPPSNPPYGNPYGYGGRDARGQPPPPPPPSADPARAWEAAYGDSNPSWRQAAAPLLDGAGDGARDFYGGRGYPQEDRRGPNDLLAGGPGCCLLIGGIDHAKINCDKLFNLLCSYGNILRIMFMRRKTDLALVEMGHPYHAQDCVQNLRKINALGMELEISRSNQACVNPVNDPFALPDGTVSYKDFSTLKLNRYTTRENADKNRPCPPQSCLHWFNAPPDMDETKLKEALTNAGVAAPISVTQHRLATGRSAAGTCEFASIQEATEALILANHTPVHTPSSHNPYMLKLAYTKARGHNEMFDRGDRGAGPQNTQQQPAYHPYGRN